MSKKVSEINSTNPYTGQNLATYDVFDLTRLDSVLDSIEQAQQQWQQTSLQARAQALSDLAVQLRKQQGRLARLASEEMGKTLASAESEVEKCAWVCDYYAEQGPAMLVDEHLPTQDDDGVQRFVSYQPLGVVLAIMPWNFPYWQVFRFLAPALMAGNAVLLKHASNVPGCALAIEQLLLDAGLSENLLRTVLVPGAKAAALIEHPVVKAVTFTGSTEAGRKIAATARRVLKKTVLELGGSDAYIILEDADVDLAVEKCVTSRLLNNGQSCIAAKRFIVHTKRYGEFAEKMTAAMARKKMGDPLDRETDVGPQAREDLCKDLAAQVTESIRLGAVLMCGGERDKAFYSPTVLSEVRPGMPAFDEELFGPVAALIRARSDEDAITLANQSMFGLGAAVFTRDHERGKQIASEQLQAGACAVNDFVKSDPRMPFGGIKASGYGRELGRFGIHEFTNIKAVVVTRAADDKG
ncbi:MAG: NAD-dependent succinate-semialdehyde dehydrogenase [Pseudohongiella sp.]